jgi:uncharacterized PurR-regulated membrane protein YhhQ (DUF165 family)
MDLSFIIMNSPLILSLAAMIMTITLSNFLVEIPINNFLTWGAFVYPFSFFINELTNCYYGPRMARRVAIIASISAFFMSLLCANIHIACASGMAFLVAQLLDISVFTRLSRKSWWLAPALASSLGSLCDTIVFFGMAFYGQGALMFSLGVGDLTVKLLVDMALLAPFRIIMRTNSQNKQMLQV